MRNLIHKILFVLIEILSLIGFTAVSATLFGDSIFGMAACLFYGAVSTSFLLATYRETHD